MARLVVVTAPEQAAGFRLAGATTEVAGSVAEALAIIQELVEGGEGGVIAVHEPFLKEMDPRMRRRLEGLTNPVVVALPTGVAVEGENKRRARLTQALRRAVGFRITFPGEEE